MMRLGRIAPKDWDHIDSYPLKALSLPTPSNVQRVMRLPWWHWTHDQGSEGSCVGHGVAMERAICNTRQNLLASILFPTRRYNPIDVWNQAKIIDEFPQTNPGDDNGTTVRAGYDVARTMGLRRVSNMKLVDNKPTPVNEKNRDPQEGVKFVRWATTVDEMRLSLSMGAPVTIGINWYSSFDDPVANGSEWWIGRGYLGDIRGGHCVCVYGASDKKQAFKIKNSWGRSYPLVWLPYHAMEILLKEDGEAALVTDL